MIRDDHHSEVRAFFDVAARTHSAGYVRSSRAGYVYSQRRDLVGRTLAQLEGTGRPLLDIGCGSGVLEATSLDGGFDYVGVDISSEMVATARDEAIAPASTFSIGRVEALAFAPDSFDVVLALGVLEYVRPDALEGAVEELARVLRPEGTLIVSLLNRSSPIWQARLWRDRAVRSIGRLRSRSASTYAPETLFTRRQLVRLLDREPLRLDHTQRYAPVLVPARVYARRPAFWEAFTLRLEATEAGPLGLLGLCHIAVATKTASLVPCSQG